MRKRLNRCLWGATAVLCFLGSVAEARLWPGGQGEIKRLLDSKDVSQRRTGARRSAELSAPLAKPLILEALRDDDREVRLLAIRVARSRGYYELSPGVAEWLSSQQVDERIEAIRFLALNLDEANAALIEGACIDADPGVRRAAVMALGGAFGRVAAKASARLVGMLDDVDPDVRQEVAASLGKLGESSSALTLAAHLKDQEANVRVQVALALGALGSQEAIFALLASLSDTHDEVVAAAAASLGESESEQAIAGLVKLAEGAPHRPQTREAILSLVRLSRFASARKVVVDLLGSPDHVVLVRSALIESPSEMGKVAADCLDSYSADLAYNCALDLLRSGSAPEKVMAAHTEGRLSVAQVLSLLEGREMREATLLALETLSSSVAADEQSAIRFLSKATALSEGADIPLLDALRARSRSAAEVVMLLNALSRVETGGRPLSPEKTKRLRAYLNSTSVEVKSAAARALAARGAEGEDLRNLLLGEGVWVKGALEGLAFRMTPFQAETVIELCKEGKSGRSHSFYSVFWAMPRGLSEKAKASALTLLARARGGDRDMIFYPLVSNWDPVISKTLTERASSLADQLKVAQLGWYEPKTLSLMRRLIKSEDAHVAAAAARAIGRHGTANDASYLQELVTSERPFIVRAAALEGLRYATYRGIALNAQSIVSTEVCSSGHDLFRAEGLRLAAALGVDCGERPLDEVLLRDRDPRMRRLAASLLLAMDPDSSALRRCGFYEPRVEVAQICRGGKLAPQSGPSQSHSTNVPYQIVEVRAQRTAARLTPATWSAPSAHFGDRAVASDHVMRLFTDRAGHVVVPREGGELVDTTWHF